MIHLHLAPLSTSFISSINILLSQSSLECLHEIIPSDQAHSLGSWSEIYDPWPPTHTKNEDFPPITLIMVQITTLELPIMREERLTLCGTQ